METLRASLEQLDWERSCHRAITSDALWKMDAYRAAMFLLHLSNQDCKVLRRVHCYDGLTAQLIDASGSVSANLAEGYSRATRVDRVRFLGYSLGSARECITWYSGAEPILTQSVVANRLDLIMRVRSLVLGLISSVRRNGDGRSPFQW
jgi:four helix bundle protein